MIKKNKKLGQHFLADHTVIDEMLAYITKLAPSQIFEIGPGAGALTKHLTKKYPVVAVELDERWCEWLKKHIHCERLQIYQQDALAYAWESVPKHDMVVGNLPYQIASELMIGWVKARVSFKSALIMMQKEVADRAMAQPGNSAYGRLTVMLATYFKTVHCVDVGPEAFDPPPKVQSSVIALTPLKEPLCDEKTLSLLEKVTAAAFSQRRKKCRHGLKALFSVEAIASCGVDPDMRPQMITPEQYISLAKQLMSRN